MSRARIIWIFLCLMGMGNICAAQTFDTKAKQAYLIDAATGTVLFQKNADEPIPPASLAKLMTLEVVFNAIKTGQHGLADQFVVSEDAWRRGGAPSGTANMFAKVKSQVPLQDLIRGVAIPIANDASLVIAEGFAGSEASFVSQMNERAKSIGMRNSLFANATGLPQDGQHITVHDIGVLARHMISSYPDQYAVYAEPEFTWNKITQKNRNPLLANTPGVDGMGLGFTKDVGYSIVVSAQRNGLRLIAVLAGIDSEKDRPTEGRKILEWGYSGFEAIPIYAENEVIGEASVFGGEAMSVPLIAHGAVKLLLANGMSEQLKANIKYNGPLVAPVVKDQPVGTLRISIGGNIVQETPVYAANDVARGALWQRALSGAQEMLTGWIRAF